MSTSFLNLRKINICLHALITWKPKRCTPITLSLEANKLIACCLSVIQGTIESKRIITVARPVSTHARGLKNYCLSRRNSVQLSNGCVSYNRVK